MAVHARMLLLVLLVYCVSSTLSAAARLAAVDNADILDNSFGISPQRYGVGKPATPALSVLEYPNNIFQRQDGFQCPAGNHTCYEIGSPSQCCDNDRYCYWTSDWQPRCCAIGNQCEDSQCPADKYLKNTTIPKTVTLSGTGSQSGTPSLLVTQSPSSGCRSQPCSTSSFLCQTVFGERCCKNGYHCATGGNCIAERDPTTSVSTIVTPIPSGCTSGQFACAESLGGSCCNFGSICAWSTVGPTASVAICSPSSTPDSNALSSGAKAGIGVGVVVVAAIVIGLVTWFCLRQRKRKSRQTNTNGTGVEMEQDRFVGGPGTAAPGGGRRGSYAATPFSPWAVRSAAAFSDGSETISSARPPLHDTGLAYEYFGPDAIPGPYTYTGEDRGLSPANPITPPLSDGSGGHIAGTPYNPDHIVRPVEIGGTEARREPEKDIGKVDIEQVAPEHERDGETEHQTGLYELAGSPGHESILDSDIVSPMDKGPSPPPPGATKK